MTRQLIEDSHSKTKNYRKAMALQSGQDSQDNRDRKCNKVQPENSHDTAGLIQAVQFSSAQFNSVTVAAAHIVSLQYTSV